ncbi:lipid phosphate phosphatase epsilon 2, chloroplastic isoform X2 [Amaranthus tricolor]|uniref:lipid phosphate phosphatase epsilon 2, chloroplastic isoform X2 n=1 Tax=Amaranthus tricolor TaxID=29722 RepID=UPI002589C4BA|nr:lipid phosphate phosphatase epsilon 2, chloroplastic isoform X2 [Amaranthus tricolor]
MSITNSLTLFPILIFPNKIKASTNFQSGYLFFHNTCFSYHPKFVLSCEFLSGKNPIFKRRRRRLMGERIIKIPALESEAGEENISVLEQETLVDGSTKIHSNFVSSEIEAILNRSSKWFVAILFGAVLLGRHDAEALWAAMGSVLNTVLSVALKRVLNQERPVANVRSDPGMPSSHAQSIFFTFSFVVLSMVEWLGWNEFTAIFAAVSLVFGSYLSWLRVTQKLHTIDQIVVGAVLGSCFSLAWFWSWDAVVSRAFNSQLWVQASIVLGAAICSLGFSLYVLLNWFRYER